MRKCNWVFLLRFTVASCELDKMECTLRTLLLRLKTVIFELGLRERTARTTFAYRNLEMFQPQLRDCTRAPLLYLKVAILEPEPSERTIVLLWYTKKLPFAIRSCVNALSVLLACLRLAFLAGAASRATFCTQNLRS